MSNVMPARLAPTEDATVLVVEDEELIAFYLEDTLDVLGYRCCGVTGTAADALKAAETHRPKIALVDIGLAGDRDGISLAKELKGRFGVAVIFLSGTTDRDTVERAKAIGPGGILSKPFLEMELSAALQAVLHIRRDER